MLRYWLLHTAVALSQLQFPGHGLLDPAELWPIAQTEALSSMHTAIRTLL